MERNNLIKKGVVVSVILLFVSVSVIPSSGTNIVEKSSTVFFDGNTLYVGGLGPGNYTKIQDAIDDASNGDTVFVYDDSSPYYENVVVNKSINLTGENRNTTIIDGNYSKLTIKIKVNYVNIKGFTIMHGNGYGLFTGIDTDHLVISDNNFINNHRGIHFGGDYSKFINNLIIDNENMGMIIRGDNNLFYGNEFANTIDEDIYLEGIYLTDSKHNNITYNVFHTLGSAIRLHCESEDIRANIITNNIIFDCNMGIAVDGNNGDYVEYNYMVNNCFINNKVGVRFNKKTQYNYIFNNNFVNNQVQGVDYNSSHNQWDNGSYGNYWSDYNGTDNNGDGIGDTPYYMPNNCQDNFPLMRPVVLILPREVKFVNDKWEEDPEQGIWNTIQAGVDNASDGDIVFVFQGTYYETVILSKSLQLIGEKSDSTILDGQGIDTFLIYADQVSIRDFMIKNATNVDSSGVSIHNQQNCTVFGCIFVDNYYGVQVFEQANNCIIRDCDFFNSTRYGIYDNQGHYNHIIDNNIIFGGGIFLGQGSHSIIRHNDISYCDRAIELGSNCQYTIIKDNNIMSNDIGIYLDAYSSNNSILNNTFVENNGTGIDFHYANLHNVIIENVFSNNSKGIWISPVKPSNHNYIYHNNFFNNTMNAYDECDNFWDNGYPSGGNYWDDYTGVDEYNGPEQNISGPDGFGDIPYEHATDHYPLMSPYPRVTELRFNGQGGIGFILKITNIGDNKVYQINWKVTMKIGYLGFINIEKDGTIDSLKQNETSSQKFFPFGFGPTTIKVTIDALNAEQIKAKTEMVFVLLFIVIMPFRFP